MSEITSATSNPFLQELALQKDTNKSDELDKNAFLKLMVAQMNNQDPLNPQENGEFIAQLAQFSSVEGIENLNSTMSVMSTNLQSSQALQASALVGRTVHVAANKTLLSEGGSISGNIKLESSTNDLTLNIFNSAGTLVDQVKMGATQRGDVRFVWAGTDPEGNALPPGAYTFSAEAQTATGTEQMETALSANVDSVTIGTDRSVILNIAGVGPTSLLDVEEIL